MSHPLVSLVPGAVESASDGGAYARPTLDVPAASWLDAHSSAREIGFNFFDWLSAVDELAAGFTVVTHLWSTSGRNGILLRTKLARDGAAVASVVAVYPGAAWHERETHEMFGISFPGHPGELKPLLLAPEFQGNPLRKDFILASRVAKDWPGAREPGESAAEGAAKRQKMRPPGVPDPNEWGPKAGTLGQEAMAADGETRPPRRAPARRTAPADPAEPAAASEPSAPIEPAPEDPTEDGAQ